MIKDFYWAISERFGLSLSGDGPEPVAGGDINRCYRAIGKSGVSYFIKVNQDPRLLEAEAGSLALMSKAAIITPAVIGFDTLFSSGVLVLQHLSLSACGDESALGRQLAELHQLTAERYGLSVNNVIGTSPQLNDQRTCWADFWWECRLAPQVREAERAGHSLGVTAAELKTLSDGLLRGHNPPASLLHGDLWAGNKAYLTDGRPVLFDPACYYGDREADLAFTLVFGGFGQDFYRRYQQAWPLPHGWQAREPLYNLYHLLNHLNMFGTAYLSSVRSAVKSLQGSHLYQ